jgi:integrase/recombinase XerC
VGDLYLLRMSHVKPVWAIEIAAWTVALRADGSAEGTIGTRSNHLRWLATWASERGPWDLELEDLRTWTGSQTWARETRRSVRSSLRSFYGWGVEAKRIDESPAEKLAPVRPSAARPHPTPEPAYYAALDSARPRERLMVRLAADCGLRRAEVAQIHTRDIFRDAGHYCLLVRGKGSKERVVPLPDDLAVTLLALGGEHGAFVFPGQDHGHLSAKYVGKLVTRLLPAGWSMHSLRHRFATVAYGESRDTFTVQELLGHASPATTKRYVRLPADAKWEVVIAVARHRETAA